MKRNPRKLGWTKAFRRAHNKELIVDSTLALQARRNVPTRYNRELVAKTLEAMERVSKIRAKRERRFYRERMKGNRARQLEDDRKLVRENQHLLPPEEREKVDDLLNESTPLDEEMAEESDEEQLEVTREQELLEKEQRAKQAIRESERKQQSEPPKVKQRRPKVIVGHGPERMDVDG